VPAESLNYTQVPCLISRLFHFNRSLEQLWVRFA